MQSLWHTLLKYCGWRFKTHAKAEQDFQAGENEEVPDGAGDVDLGLKVVMPPQYLGGGIGVSRVPIVHVGCHMPTRIVLSSPDDRRETLALTVAQDGTLPFPNVGRIQPVDSCHVIEVGVSRDDAVGSETLHHRGVNQVPGAYVRIAVRQLRS